MRCVLIALVLLLQRKLDHELAQRTELYADLLGSVGQQGGCRHARQGVRLEDPHLTAGVADDVRAGNTAAAKCLMRLDGDALGLFELLGGDARGDNVRAAARSILCLEIIEGAGLLGDDLDNGKGLGILVAKNGDRSLDTCDEGLDQQEVVVLKRLVDGTLQVLFLSHHGHADRGTFACGFDHAMLAHLRNDIVDVVGLAAHQGYRLRRRQPGGSIDLLRASLIHGQSARQNTGSGVREPQELEETLHAAVLTVATVKRAVNHVGLAVDDLLDHVAICGIDLRNRETHALETFGASGTRTQGDFALTALSALQKRNLNLCGVARSCCNHDWDPSLCSIHS